MDNVCYKALVAERLHPHTRAHTHTDNTPLKYDSVAILFINASLSLSLSKK
jgi:hypothetical protein